MLLEPSSGQTTPSSRVAPQNSFLSSSSLLGGWVPFFRSFVRCLPLSAMNGAIRERVVVHLAHRCRRRMPLERPHSRARGPRARGEGGRRPRGFEFARSSSSSSSSFYPSNRRENELELYQSIQNRWLRMTTRGCGQSGML